MRGLILEECSERGDRNKNTVSLSTRYNGALTAEQFLFNEMRIVCVDALFYIKITK